MLSAKRASSIIEATTFLTAPGLIRVDYAIAAEKSPEDAIFALRILQSFASAMPALADEIHARSMYAAAGAYGEAKTPSAKYGKGGVLTEFRKQGMYLLQEQRRGQMNAAPFAGRYRLTGTEPANKPPVPKADPIPAPASLIRKAAVAEPIFDCPNSGATSCDEAFHKGRRLRLLVNPWPDLVPSFDLSVYNALAATIGVPQMDSPLL